MCANFEPVVQRERLKTYFDVDTEAPCPAETWPGQKCRAIRRSDKTGAQSVEVMSALYGLIPHWAKTIDIGRRTYNARSETVAELPSFRDAWRQGQHCIVPMEAFYEPCWETGQGIRWRIANADQTPLGVAGLWSTWRTPDHRLLHSLTLLTINADGHPLMQRFHRPEDEKRMVVVLQPQDYAAWLEASPDESGNFLQPYDAGSLVAKPAPLVRPTRRAAPAAHTAAATSQGTLF